MISLLKSTKKVLLAHFSHLESHLEVGFFLTKENLHTLGHPTML